MYLKYCKKIILNCIFLFFILLSSAGTLNAQKQLKVETEKGTMYISVFERQGMIYFSPEEFADAVSVPLYKNNNAGKLELKFTGSNLLITEKNPYLLVTKKPEGTKSVYQLPTSTYTVNNKVYIPLLYTIEILNSAYDNEVSFIPPDRLIVKGSVKPVVPDIKPTAGVDINGITVDVKANGTLIRVKSKKRILSYNSSYKDGVLTFVFRKALVDSAALTGKINKGIVKSISAKNINGDTEIKFMVSDEYSASEVLNADKSNDLLITLHNKTYAAGSNKLKEKWNFDVIVIDPGHGGKDGGAVGVNGALEKNINLAVSLKLGKLIEKNMKDVKVVYTRSNDTFVELYKRGKIANDNSGKLFISIHCNSAPKKPGTANGFEIYLLRPGRTKEAIAIAETENSVIQYEENPDRYQKLTDENFILVSMAHSAYMKYSEKFSEILNKQFTASLAIPSRGVKQAGFYVLVGASMPSVLIETGFLSNKKDAAYLSGTKGQSEIAEAIFQGIKKFKGYYESALKDE